jgi:hypothetical protein
MLEMNQRWINCKGGRMTIMNEKMIVILEISYLSQYAKAKKLQKVNKVWTLWVRPSQIGILSCHFELWIC